MRSEKVTFEGTQAKLAARLDRPEGTPRAFALFAHCFTCSKDIFAASRIAQGLAERGIATLRFDFTGLGHSDGEFENTNFTTNIEDLIKAADFLREEYEAPRILVGHSLGGAAVLAAAGQIEEVEAVATIAAPYDPQHVANHFTGAIERAKEEGVAEVTIAGRPFRVKQQFFEDIEGQPQKERIEKLRKPLLIFHAPLDGIVGIDNASNIFLTAKHPKSFVSLDSADHLLSDRRDAEYVAEVLAGWAGRYVGGLTPPELDSAFEPGAGHTVVAEAKSGKFTQIADAGGHTLIGDEPVDYGGDNLGPTPYGFLLTALGTCTAMTVRLYADRKKLPLEHVSVKLTHEKIHAKDCEDCETRDGKLDEIKRIVELRGDDLDEDQRRKLLDIADKCPVHRTLHSEIKVRTEEQR